ncbi:MAG: patatin family protein [Clostridia bacterium]
METPQYTHPPIPGRLPGKMLPPGSALVLEGGGTRGFYSAGVFEAFMDAGIMFPYIIGVSAGAANAVTYLSGQRLRSRQIVENYVGNPRYVSMRNFIFHRSMFNMEYIFHTIPQRHVAFDWETFRKCRTRFLTGAMDCASGKTVWFEKEEITPDFKASIASCSVPILSPIVKFKEYELLDGGVSDPIPIEKSIADGNRFHVIVLTRNAGYTKSAFGHRRFLKIFYRKYPQVAEAMLRRHEVYNRQLTLCEQLAREGRAVIVRPLKPLRVKRTSADPKALLALYDEGHDEGAAEIERILSLASDAAL